jgi:hypothetical protein
VSSVSAASPPRERRIGLGLHSFLGACCRHPRAECKQQGRASRGLAHHSPLCGKQHDRRLEPPPEAGRGSAAPDPAPREAGSHQGVKAGHQARAAAGGLRNPAHGHLSSSQQVSRSVGRHSGRPLHLSKRARRLQTQRKPDVRPTPLTDQGPEDRKRNSTVASGGRGALGPECSQSGMRAELSRPWRARSRESRRNPRFRGPRRSRLRGG